MAITIVIPLSECFKVDHRRMHVSNFIVIL